MTAKEKAKELIDKYNVDLRPFSEYGHWDIYHAKQCALICVDELINESTVTGNFIKKPYWEQVKKEIELL